MKNDRQSMILEIISQENIETQEQLLVRLQERGITSTQATISRDIKQMHLIKEPVAQTMVVCPICTHNMRFSSYVLSPEHTLTIELERNGRKPVYLFVDESRAFSLKADDKIQVRRSKHTVRLVRLSERSFCEIFAQKMLPGGFEDEK